MGKNYQKQITELQQEVKKIGEAIANKEYSGDTIFGDIQTLIAGFRLYQEVLQMVNKNTQQQMAQVQPMIRENQYTMRFHKERGLDEDYATWKEGVLKEEAEAQAKANEEAQKRLKENQDAKGSTTTATPDSPSNEPGNEGGANKQPDPDPR